jgi:hypothetical protein
VVLTRLRKVNDAGDAIPLLGGADWCCMLSVRCPGMLRVTSSATLAARAKSLNVLRSPRCDNFLPKPMVSVTSTKGLFSTDGLRKPPCTAGKQEKDRGALHAFRSVEV